jgi:hypothetical protein
MALPKATGGSNPPENNCKPTNCDDYIRSVVDSAPPLTLARQAKLSGLFDSQPATDDGGAV